MYIDIYLYTFTYKQHIYYIDVDWVISFVKINLTIISMHLNATLPYSRYRRYYLEPLQELK